jgi:hypothetical protein
MANISNLVDAAKGFVPVIQDIFKIWSSGGDTSTIATGPLDKLSQLLAQANQQTDDPNGALRGQAIVALSGALTEVLNQAAQTSNVAINGAMVREINNECDALQTALGLLTERETFKPIAQLLPSQELDHIKQEISDANDAIKNRQTAQKVLETTVDVMIVAAEIAVKVAAM